MTSKGAIMQHKRRRRRLFLLASDAAIALSMTASAIIPTMTHASNNRNNRNRIGDHPSVADEILSNNDRMTKSNVRELQKLSRILKQLHWRNELSSDTMSILHSLESTSSSHNYDGSTHTRWLDEMERMVATKVTKESKRRRLTDGSRVDKSDRRQQYPFQTHRPNLRRGILSPEMEPMGHQHRPSRDERKVAGLGSILRGYRSLSGSKSGKSEFAMYWVPAPYGSSSDEESIMINTVEDNNDNGDDDKFSSTMGDDDTSADDGLLEEIEYIETYDECYEYHDLEYDDDAGYIFEDLIPVLIEGGDDEDDIKGSEDEGKQDNEKDEEENNGDEDHKGDDDEEDGKGSGSDEEDDDEKDDEDEDHKDDEDPEKYDDDKEEDVKEEEEDDDDIEIEEDEMEDDDEVEDNAEENKDDDMNSENDTGDTESPSIVSPTTSPSIALATARPSPASETASPSVAPTTSPSIALVTARPSPASETVSPSVSPTTSPSIALATARPPPAAKTASPTTVSVTTIPTIVSDTSSPSITSVTSSPTIVSNTYSPSSVPASSSPSTSQASSRPSLVSATASPSLALRKLQSTIYVYNYAKSSKATKSSKLPSSMTEAYQNQIMPSQHYGKSSKSAGAKSGKTKSGKRCFIIKKDDEIAEDDISDGYCGKDFEDASSNCEEKCKSDDDCSGKDSCFGGISECSPAGDKYCGEDFTDASKCADKCDTDSDCRNGESCYGDVTECVEEVKVQYCGVDFDDAAKCTTKCESDDDCFGDESCFADITDCSEGEGSSEPTLAPTLFLTALTGAPTQTVCPDGCLDCSPDAPLQCPPQELKKVCDKHNNELYPPGSSREGEREANFIDCYEMCKPSFCCIHDSVSKEYAPSCSHEFDNCPLYYPCYIIWWKLHDTIGPATYMRVEQEEPFYEGVKFEYFREDFAEDQAFFQQLFGHHFDTDDAPTDDTFENEENW